MGSDTAPVGLMDCTLREAPYEYDFSTAEMIELLRAKRRAGLQYVEVGAETGLGTRSDLDEVRQVRTAVHAVPDLSIGVIAGALVTPLDLIRQVVDVGASFVRIAAPVTRSAKAMGLIETVSSWGVPVTFNAVKAYAVSDECLVRIAKDVTSAGAQVFYIVDSAGCMLPSRTARVTAALHRAGITVGFHGHDNLALAVANSLVALQAGAAVVDGTLRGVGRSAGNAQIEVLVKAAQQAGWFPGIDGDVLCRAGEELVAPHRARDRGVSYLDVAMGEGRFHSERLDLAREVAATFRVCLTDLVREVGRRDPISPMRELVEAAAADLRAEDVTRV